MATNKNAQLRYQILDRCFSNFGRQNTIDDLVEEVNDRLLDINGTEVSLRQIREDIKFMRDSVGYNAPIEAYQYDGRKCFYRYSERNFTIFNNELSETEVGNLRQTVNILRRFRGLPSFSWIEEVVSNLEYRFGGKTTQENVITFDQNERLRGLEHLPVLIDAAINHQALRLLYCSYKGIEHDIVVSPYHLKQYNNRWFLFALEEGKKLPHVSTYALDRIVKVSKSSTEFVPNTEIDFSKCFEDIVGVTMTAKDGARKERVVLRFSPKRFPYVVSKPLHPSQQVICEEECTIELSIYPNPELRSLIFSFVPDVEVIEPQWYRKAIKKKLEENLKKYDNDEA